MLRMTDLVVFESVAETFMNYPPEMVKFDKFPLDTPIEEISEKEKLPRGMVVHLTSPDQEHGKHENYLVVGMGEEVNSAVFHVKYNGHDCAEMVLSTCHPEELNEVFEKVIEEADDPAKEFIARLKGVKGYFVMEALVVAAQSINDDNGVTAVEVAIPENVVSIHHKKSSKLPGEHGELMDIYRMLGNNIGAGYFSDIDLNEEIDRIEEDYLKAKEAKAS